MLKALLACAGKKDVRYYLNAVNIDEVDGALRFSASDGHLLLQVVFSKDVRETYFPDVVLGSRALLCRKSLDIGVRQKGQRLVAVDGVWAFGACGLSLVDGRSPDITRAISLGLGSKSAAEKGVDFALLKTLSGSMADLQKAFGKMPCGLLVGRDATSPFIFTGQPCAGVKWEAALMPCRV